MEKRMLEKKTPPLNQHQCHDDISSNNSHSKRPPKAKVNTDYFESNVTCKNTCQNKSIHQKVIPKRFTPEDFGLYQGDGSSNEKILWRSLGSTLSIWSKNVCLNQAITDCNNLKNISDIEVVSISSGNWSMNSLPSCSNKKIIYSPFDNRFTLNNVPKENKIEQVDIFGWGKTEPIKPKNKSEHFTTNLSQDNVQKLFNNKECSYQIKVSTCFGDCVFENKNSNWNETINTNQPLGEEEFTLCADNFVEQFKNKPFIYTKIKCEQLVWEIIQKSQSMGSSCAALRYDIDCSKLKSLK